VESSVAAIASFSHFPGAKHRDAESIQQVKNDSKQKSLTAMDATTEHAKALENRPVAPLAPLEVKELENSLVLLFPEERFDLEVAGRLGKKDWDAILAPHDPIDGAVKDTIYRDGADFVAPIEFLSEVFVDGKPLNKRLFTEQAISLQGAQQGAKTMAAHFPRFGPVLLIARENGSRIVTSMMHNTEQLLALLD